MCLTKCSGFFLINYKNQQLTIVLLLFWSVYHCLSLGTGVPFSFATVAIHPDQNRISIKYTKGVDMVPVCTDDVYSRSFNHHVVFGLSYSGCIVKRHPLIIGPQGLHVPQSVGKCYTVNSQIIVWVSSRFDDHKCDTFRRFKVAPDFYVSILDFLFTKGLSSGHKHTRGGTVWHIDFKYLVTTFKF